MPYQSVSTEKLLDLGDTLLIIKDMTTLPYDPLVIILRETICDELSAIDAELELRQPVVEWPLVEVVYLDGAGVGVEVETELLEGAEDKLWASI